MGPVSRGLCVRDFDEEEAYVQWAKDHADLAKELPTSRTARGYHVFFLADGRDPGLLDQPAVVKLSDGELRIHNCQVLLPPSTHPDGGRYHWLRAPFHGVKMVYSVQAAGLLPEVSPVASKVDSGGARARSTLSCHSMPSHYHRREPLPDLFSSEGDSDGAISRAAFDELLGWTVPTGPGMRESCLWKLARTLKSLQETRQLPLDELKPLVKHWWLRARPVIRTKGWWHSWGAFARCWKRAVVPLSEGDGFQAIVERARRQSCPPEVAAEFGMDISGLVVAICRELAIEAQGGVFFLNARALGQHSGICQWEASECLRALEASRVIKVVSAARKGKSKEFVYLLPLGDAGPKQKPGTEQIAAEKNQVESEPGERK